MVWPILAGIGKAIGGVLGASTATVGGSMLASVGGSLVSGLLGDRGGGTQTTTSYVDYEDLRRRAEAAGFNPLTALQNGGSAGFATQSTTLPKLSSSQVLKNAAAEGIKTWFNRDQIMRDAERDRLELDLMKAELKSLNDQSAIVRDRDFGYSIPHAVQRAGGYNAAVSGGFVPLASRPADGRNGGADGPAGSSRVAGHIVPHNPDWDDAQKIEDRYGDFASWAYGTAVIGADGLPYLKSRLAEHSAKLRRFAEKGAPRSRPVHDLTGAAPRLRPHGPPAPLRSFKAKPKTGWDYWDAARSPTYRSPL